MPRGALEDRNHSTGRIYPGYATARRDLGIQIFQKRGDDLTQVEMSVDTAVALGKSVFRDDEAGHRAEKTPWADINRVIL